MVRSKGCSGGSGQVGTRETGLQQREPQGGGGAQTWLARVSVMLRGDCGARTESPCRLVVELISVLGLVSTLGWVVVTPKRREMRTYDWPLGIFRQWPWHKLPNATADSKFEQKAERGAVRTGCSRPAERKVAPLNSRKTPSERTGGGRWTYDAGTIGALFALRKRTAAGVVLVYQLCLVVDSESLFLGLRVPSDK